jgi:hypothetical protein
MSQFILVFGGALLATAVGIAYWIKAPREASMWRRALASAYGPAIALIFVITGFFWPDAYRYTRQGAELLLWLQALPAGLLLCSLIWYSGSRTLHLLLVPIALFAWLWTFAFQYIAVNGM